MIPGELYQSDVIEWSEHQAALLRRRAAGELVNETELDWPNIAEEIESVGREQLSAVESLLLQSIVHELKCDAWPGAADAEKWRADARLFRVQASLRYAPSMRQRIDLQKLYAKALWAMPETIDGQPPQPVPQSCPATLDTLLGEGPA